MALLFRREERRAVRRKVTILSCDNTMGVLALWRHEGPEGRIVLKENSLLSFPPVVLPVETGEDCRRVVNLVAVSLISSRTWELLFLFAWLAGHRSRAPCFLSRQGLPLSLGLRCIPGTSCHPDSAISGRPFVKGRLQTRS